MNHCWRRHWPKRLPISWQSSAVTQILQGVTAIVSVCPVQVDCLWLLQGVGAVALIEHISADSSLGCHPPSPPTLQFLFNPFFSFPAQALAVARLCSFPSHMLHCVLAELTCVEQCGGKSSFLMSWSLTSFLYLFQNQNKKSFSLVCLLHLLFSPFGSHQNRAEDAAAVGNKHKPSFVRPEQQTASPFSQNRVVFIYFFLAEWLFIRKQRYI